MNTKKIDFVMHPQSTHWVGDGFRVHNFIPSVEGLSMRDMDPFILLDYNAKREVAPSTIPGGVGVHPHRGFETVTIAYEGMVEHNDSAGNGGVIGQGDVQWMTAARGVLHKEYHAKEWAQKGGTFQMVQLWTNLPRKNKMSEPRYQALPHQTITRVQLPNGTGYIEVIAGEYKGNRGPAKTHSPIHLMNAKLHEGADAEFSFPAHYNTALLVIQGSIEIQGIDVPVDNLLKFANEGESFTLRATAPDTVVLIMSGEPLNEPIVSYGPFVMNTKEEILQAYDDLNHGKFGYLED